MPHEMPDHRRLRRLGSTLLCLACLAAAPVAVSAADTGGGATADLSPNAGPDPAATGSTTGSAPKAAAMAGPAKPRLITCRTQCLGLDTAQIGSTVRVTGDALGQVTAVVFKGGSGSGDDVRASVTPVAPDAVDVVVPDGAASGPVAAVTADGTVSRPTRRTIVLGATARSSAGGGPAARVDTGRVYFRGAHQATLSVFVPAGPTRHVTVDLLRASDSSPMAHWELDVAGATVQSVTWNGLVNRNVQRDGRYSFQVQTAVPGASTAQQAPLATSFTFFGNIFPVRGKHSFGGDAARFGTGRAGHTHQGQDTFAACGTPLVAARGGTVKFQAYQSAAGNYLVIDGAGTGTDYVYMHLKDPALVTKGQTVYTGQPIGEVGDTGDANGCHLHMELWSAPGWYTGGAPFDPLPSLKRWDRQSAPGR